MSLAPGVKRQVLIAAILYFGQLILGYNLSWSGPIIPKLQNPDESPLSHELTETQVSLVGSLVYLGSIPGPFLVGWLSNYQGRKPCFILGGILTTLTYIILLFTKNLPMLFIGRILNSCGLSIIVVTNIVYIGEMASTHIRGILLAAIGIFTTFGSIIMFSVGPFLSYQGTIYVGMAISVIFTAAVLSIPESPMYYVLKVQAAEAVWRPNINQINNLVIFKYSNMFVDEEEKVLETLKKLGRLEDKDILFETKKEYSSTNEKMDWVELFTLKTNKKSLFIVLSMNILQHLSGVMAVIFFSSSIFEMANSSIDYNYAMIIIGCFQLVGSVISPTLIDSAGRRKLLLFSTAACCMSMLAMGTYFYLLHLNLPALDSVKWLPLVILTFFFIGYDSGLGIIPNCLIGEMFTTNVRSKGSCVALTSTWIAGFLLTTAFGSVVDNLGPYVAFWFFSFTCACAFVFTILYIPETKKISLLEIQKCLGK